MLLGNSWSNLHIKCLELDIMFGFTCVSENFTKFPNIMNRIVKVAGVIQINIFKISFEKYIQNSPSLFSFTDWEPTDEIICFKVNILIQIVLIFDSIFCDDEMMLLWYSVIEEVGHLPWKLWELEKKDKWSGNNFVDPTSQLWLKFSFRIFHFGYLC